VTSIANCTVLLIVLVCVIVPALSFWLVICLLSMAFVLLSVDKTCSYCLVSYVCL